MTLAKADGTSGWTAAAKLIARWLDRRERVDDLLDSADLGLSGPERARCQHLVFGVVRHYGRIDAELGRLIAHPPRFATRAVLFIAGFELVEAATAPVDGQVAKIVHHAVERTKELASPAEAKLVNAVVRKLAATLQTPPPPKLATANALADYFSHPDWLVKRWLLQFGAEPTRKLLEWNQRPATVYARWRSTDSPPEWLKPTAWEGFFEVPSGHWTEIQALLKAGKLYLQDPATRLAVDLLAPLPGEKILDACAAPGGKSLMIADKLGKNTDGSRLVAIDLPGARIDRLKENLARVENLSPALVQGDVMRGAAKLFAEHGLPETYDAILIDVPCSNTGVMRHRVDVKWRLQEGDFRQHAKQQLALLASTARLVAPNGRIVYSTCSVDAEENERVVERFLKEVRGAFVLEKSVTSLPWETGHDGAGAFLLLKK